MEINQTQERKVYNMTADQGEWTVNATAAVVDGKVQNIDGSAFKTGNEGRSVTFNGYRNGDGIMRAVHNVTNETADAYGVVEEFIDSVLAKYEGE